VIYNVIDNNDSAPHISMYSLTFSSLTYNIDGRCLVDIKKTTVVYMLRIF